MKCPADDATLVMSERQGVEIDYCPTCRGVWLDRGELDKIIDRAAVELAPVDRDDDRNDRDDRDDRRRRDALPVGGDPRNAPMRARPHKKKSFLGEMFEFGD